MADDRIEAAKERVVSAAIDYSASRPGDDPADKLRDAIDYLVELAQAIALASLAQAAINVSRQKGGSQ